MTLCLVVEDDPIARQASVTMTRELDISTAEADDGKQAAGFCMGCMPDIILLDIMMPNLDGREFMKRLRTLPNGEKPFVIVNSAMRDQSTIDEMITNGANAFLPKPFGIEELYKVLDDASLLPEHR